MKKKKRKKKKKHAIKSKKSFELEWVFGPFDSHLSFSTRRMFGGLAAYCHGKMVMLLAESPGESSYRGREYEFEIWNGILFPTEREHHEALLSRFPQLRSHPVLGKWLYLPLSTAEFDSVVEDLTEMIAENSPLLGIFPKDKTKRPRRKK